MSRPGTHGASGAWGLGVVRAGAAAQVGLSGNLPGSEGMGPSWGSGAALAGSPGWWCVSGYQLALLLAWASRSAVPTPWQLEWALPGSWNLKSCGVAALESAGQRHVASRPPTGAVLCSGGASPGICWPTAHGFLEPLWAPATGSVYPCHLLPSLPHLRAPPAAPVHTPASRLTGDPRTRPQAPPVPTSPPGEPVGSLWPTCERVPSSVHPPRSWVLVWGRRQALLGVLEQSPSRDSTFSLADPACPPAPGAALAGDPEAWMVVPASGRGPRGPTAECSGLHPSWRTGVSGQAALGVGRAPFPLGLWGHNLLQRRAPGSPEASSPWLTGAVTWCSPRLCSAEACLALEGFGAEEPGPPSLPRGGPSTHPLKTEGQMEGLQARQRPRLLTPPSGCCLLVSPSEEASRPLAGRPALKVQDTGPPAAGQPPQGQRGSPCSGHQGQDPEGWGEIRVPWRA